jgi:glycosyltransferase involved in cell wall biosynthesis
METPCAYPLYPGHRMSAQDVQRGRRVALVTPGYPPTIGGVERHVAHLAAGLAGLGHHVDVLTHDADGAPAHEMPENAVRVFRFPRTVRARHYALSAPMARYLVRHAGKYDVVHAHNYHALPLLLASATAAGRSVLTPHYHGDSASSFRSVLHKVYRFPGGAAMRRASKVICVSSSEAALVSSELDVAADRLIVIPNGVDADRLRRALPFPNMAPTALVVGRLDRYKRVDQVIEAMTELSGLQLRVIGGGDDLQRLETITRAAGIAERVQFLNRVSDDELARWFATARVVVSLSEHEAFGLVAAEALAAGAPVALSDIPAHRDIARLCPDRCRLIAETSDRLAVARAMSVLADLPRRVVDVPDWQSVAEQTAAVYETLAPRSTP